MSDDTDRDYEVGYGKPPKDKQFQKGRSGNPKGRPQESRTSGTIVQRELRERVAVRENGCTKTITKREAILIQLINRATTGDLRAIKFLFLGIPWLMNDLLNVQRPGTVRDRLAEWELVKRMVRGDLDSDGNDSAPAATAAEGRHLELGELDDRLGRALETVRSGSVWRTPRRKRSRPVQS